MNKKKVAALLVAGVLSIGAIGGTLAWFTSQDSVTNAFQTGSTDNPGDLDSGVKVVEDFEKPTNVLPGDEVNKDVQVRNTSTYPQFIRVKIEKNFVKVVKDLDGSERRIPVSAIESNGQRYELDTKNINLNFTSHLSTDKSNGSWLEGTDGYYYYIGKVDGKSWTNTLLDSVTLKSDAGNEYKNLGFDVKITADSIQASNSAYDGWCNKSLNEIYKGLEKTEAIEPTDNLEPTDNKGHIHKTESNTQQ